MRYVVHVVLEGGAVADDLYVGPFRHEDRAVEVANRIERVAERLGAPLGCLVREILPGPTSARRVIEEAGL